MNQEYQKSALAGANSDEVLKKLKQGKAITMGADLFGVVLLLVMYFVLNDYIYLYLSIFLLVAGIIFYNLVSKAEKKYLDRISK
ncbi:MAG: hypothetical protein Kapaf2KO_18090 [Candidatus Kapaibacteriales bacterium]